MEVIEELNLAFNGIQGKYFPKGREQDIKYNFFIDLQHGYCNTAGSYIHLYADNENWAIIFEKCGYFNRATSAEIELTYIGNCITYQVDEYPERNYISNVSRVTLIDSDEYKRIENKEGTEMETFELIDAFVKEIKVRDATISFENSFHKYIELGIKIRDYDNPEKLIGFSDIIRYLHETNPDLISATEADIKKCIPIDLPKLLKIPDFHYTSTYDKENLPGNQEINQLIARILVTKDIGFWKPTQKANNHWRNWESGNL